MLRIWHYPVSLKPWYLQPVTHSTARSGWWWCWGDAGRPVGQEKEQGEQVQGPHHTSALSPVPTASPGLNHSSQSYNLYNANQKKQHAAIPPKHTSCPTLFFGFRMEGLIGLDEWPSLWLYWWLGGQVVGRMDGHNRFMGGCVGQIGWLGCWLVDHLVGER